MTLPFKIKSCFSNSHDQVKWEGQSITNKDDFQTYLSDPVYKRLVDDENRKACIEDLTALATTGMESNTIENLLASEPDPQAWEVGEALAECLLRDIHNVQWPWNNERDKRTPKASLPGADLVGFLIEGDNVRLLLGEVKTSKQTKSPPQVMIGRTGMTHQLDKLATNISIHFALIKWLKPRCTDSKFEDLYEKAAKQYISTNGQKIVLWGLLMRDTEPNELDLRNRGLALGDKVKAPTRVELTAWYLPLPIQDWTKLAKGGTG